MQLNVPYFKNRWLANTRKHEPKSQFIPYTALHCIWNIDEMNFIYYILATEQRLTQFQQLPTTKRFHSVKSLSRLKNVYVLEKWQLDFYFPSAAAFITFHCNLERTFFLLLLVFFSFFWLMLLLWSSFPLFTLNWNGLCWLFIPFNVRDFSLLLSKWRTEIISSDFVSHCMFQIGHHFKFSLFQTNNRTSTFFIFCQSLNEIVKLNESSSNYCQL